MRFFSNKLFLVLILLCTFYTNAQDYLMTLKSTEIKFLEKEAKKFGGETLINDGTYTYIHEGSEVEVIYQGDQHYEFYNDKRHFIKSKLFWVAKDIVYLTIEDFSVPDFPFKIGTTTKIEITKKEKDFVYYKSTLGGRTWMGKMKKINLL